MNQILTLENPCNESIFIKPYINKEIIDMISDLSNYKAMGRNNNSAKILKLAKGCIAINLPVHFNLSFILGVLPDTLQIAKLPVF